MCETLICKNCGHSINSHHSKTNDGEVGFCSNCSDCTSEPHSVEEHKRLVEQRKKEMEETEIRTEKLKKITVTITIDGESVVLPSLEIFFMWKSANIYGEHTKWKQFLKRCMDKQLEKVK